MSVIEGVRRLLSSTLMRRVRNGLGGSHTVVTYPPLDALTPHDGVEPFEIGAPQGGVNAYFHVAFCEWICAFCHYAKTLHSKSRPSSEVDDYLSAMEDEVAMRAGSIAGADLKSIYIGGGTPTSLEPYRLDRLLALATSLSDGHGTELCVETSPTTLAADDGREKLSILKDRGATRLSIGVQSFDITLLPDLRGHDGTVLTHAVERLCSAGLTVNIDLIQDLPGQTRDSLRGDLAWIRRLKPQQVTWYLLRFHSESSMGKSWGNGKPAELVDDLESALRRDMIIREMADLGYRSMPGCRFAREGVVDHYKTVRGGVDRHLLGFGVSSYSHGWGWFFRNLTSSSIRSAVREYRERLRKGSSPVAWATPITQTERRAGRLCEAARATIRESLVAGDSDSARATRSVLQRLVDAQLMSRSDQGWELTRIGKLFEEEVVSLFYSSDMRRRLYEANAYWADQSWFAPTSRTNPSNAILAAIRASSRG